MFAIAIGCEASSGGKVSLATGNEIKNERASNKKSPAGRWAFSL
jgi:hypothetical protein